ncbi:hypothetical protein DXD59_09450 [Olsenella sp. TM06-36]|nr:hypothetical protein DXD59_09450 [Olsenella sp. TM06-36]RGS52075.1 hypothetical protein DWX86_04765 [Olsenella sp. AF21-51]RHB54451.1 hypothetical protein DW878_08840 [Olsenella sp. AM39-30AC]
MPEPAGVSGAGCSRISASVASTCGSFGSLGVSSAGEGFGVGVGSGSGAASGTVMVSDFGSDADAGSGSAAASGSGAGSGLASAFSTWRGFVGLGSCEPLRRFHGLLLLPFSPALPEPDCPARSR